MIETSIKTLLKDALISIRAASTGETGWERIIAMYEKAIAQAEQDKYFTVKDAPRLYLEFNSDYLAEVFIHMDKVASETKKYFQQILGNYIVKNVGANGLDGKLKELTRYPDIFGEFVNFILAGEKFEEASNVTVEGYTAKRLSDETILTPLGAFNYLVYLKEEPKEALENLKKGLPRRKVFNETDLKKIRTEENKPSLPNHENTDQ